MIRFFAAILIVGCCVTSVSFCSADELKPADILNVKGDGPDGKGNTADDTWQFWFELAHSKGVFHRFNIATSKMPAGQRKSGIPRRVRGPIASLLPNPSSTEGWIYHRDWDGRFEGVWADKKKKEILIHPYVESGSHCAVAITWRAKEKGTFDITGKLTDLQIKPNYPKHDGILWRIEKVTGAGKERGKLLGKGGPIGDGKGRPDFGTLKVSGAQLNKGDFIRLVIHPNRWWGQDLTRIDYLRIKVAN